MLIHKLETMEYATKTDQSLICYILEHGDKAIKMSVRELAAAVFVSPSAVIRFYKKTGVDSFGDFKVQLAADLSNSLSNRLQIDADMPFLKDDSNGEIIKKISHLKRKGIKETESLIADQVFKHTIRDIQRARTISIYGMGFALDGAITFRHQMSRIGYPVYLESDYSRQTNWASNARRGDFGILLSYSGETTETLKVASILQQNHVTTLAITGEGESRLKCLATHHIPIARIEGNIFYSKIGGITSIGEIAFILDSIYCCIFACNYDDNVDKINTNEVLQKNAMATIKG